MAIGKRKWTFGQLVNAVKNNDSLTGVCNELGLSRSSYTVKKYIGLMELDISHFTRKPYIRDYWWASRAREEKEKPL